MYQLKYKEKQYKSWKCDFILVGNQIEVLNCHKILGKKLNDFPEGGGAQSHAPEGPTQVIYLMKHLDTVSKGHTKKQMKHQKLSVNNIVPGLVGIEGEHLYA